MADFAREEIQGPLYLYLAFSAERTPRPSDGADVLQSVDDMYRLAERFNILSGQFGGADEFGFSRDPLSREEFIRGLLVGGGDTPLAVSEFRFGSPMEVVTEIPWGLLAAGGGWGTFCMLLSQVERLWNMPKRIRVESKRLDADEVEQERRLWEERTARLSAERAYWRQRRAYSGRSLQGVPEDPAFTGIEGRVLDERPELPQQRELPGDS